MIFLKSFCHIPRKFVNINLYANTKDMINPQKENDMKSLDIYI